MTLPVIAAQVTFVVSAVVLTSTLLPARCRADRCLACWLAGVAAYACACCPSLRLLPLPLLPLCPLLPAPAESVYVSLIPAAGCLKPPPPTSQLERSID